jgi:5-oxoprolinase (ATP-hydrolysing)
MAIETVAAGGGSICACRSGALAVGPGSAGADPGPACYGAGGPLTLTDVNLLLGRLDPGRFGIPVWVPAAREALERVWRDVVDQTGTAIAAEELLEGFLELADERMADAIRKVSVRRGYEPAGHALVAFGGAGPMHACAVAARLGMETVIVPDDAGLLSAVGLGQAPVEKFRQRQVLRPLERVETELPALLATLADEARRAVEADGVPSEQVIVRRRIAALRLLGQDTALQVEVEQGRSLAEGFRARFEALYGHAPAARPVEVESLKVVASSRQEDPVDAPEEPEPHPARTEATIRARFDGAWQRVPCLWRPGLRPGATVPAAAPAVVMGPYSTVVKPRGWELSVDGRNALLLQRQEGHGGAAGASPRSKRHEAVELELFVGRMEAIAEEMGELLARTALSTNIKERRDFSCALLDAEGELVVNAPHIPVHLGSLGLCVRRLRAAGRLGRGEVVVTNHPGYGGSHLPDVTVVTPVDVGDARVGYVASRAHHAEIGGTRPGSMPPQATALAEEGVVIPPLTLIDARGEARWERLEALLGSEAPYPSRAVADNLADIRAAVAANTLGARALSELAARRGAEGLRRHMAALKRRAERQIRRALGALPDGVHRARAALDDGTPLAVAVEVAGDGATIDLTGSGAVHRGNLNATPAVVRGVVIYVLRLLVDRPLPLNEGMMRAVTLKIPPGLLDPPFEHEDPARLPAVMGGNVETSQQLVDLLLGALGVMAASQGTMNNVVFGDERFGYYETVGGGSGAGPRGRGADAVHSHMTNTRITDVEVLEQRYPVRVERFAVRRGSGGGGRHPGGAGAVRELAFLAPLSLSLLSQRRVHGAPGLAGGEAGLPGAQRLLRADGEAEALEGVDGREVEPGDRLVLETPGGGGWGRPRPLKGAKGPSSPT